MLKSYPSFLILLLTISSLVFSQNNHITIGQNYYQNGEYQKAINTFEENLAKEGFNYESLWRLSQAQCEFGNSLNDEDKKEELYKSALENAKKATELNKQGDMGFAYFAISSGRMAIFKGGKEKLQLSKDVKSYAEKAIQLNSKNDLAYHTLARWNREVTNLSWMKRMAIKVIYDGLPEASFEKAVELFQRAISIDPDYNNHHLELAETYKLMGQKDLAKKELEIASSLEPKSAKEKVYKQIATEKLAKF
ncbi:MAG: hypothetical protein DWQ06_09875 [Calditrichaeota bacterium]|nr:MAG: hypothetical protein DWQ06_09875 [Calditrichota bacterium]